MEESLHLTTVAILTILIIGFYVFVIRRGSKGTTGGETTLQKEKTEITGPPATLNAPPEALEPFVVGNAEWGERLLIDARYRKHGCDAGGAPTSESGVYDPDNELLEFWFEVTRPDRDAKTVHYAVYSSRGERVDCRWLPNDFFPVYYRERRDPNSPTEQNAVVYSFVGRTNDEPPYPIVADMDGCVPTPRPDAPQPAGAALGVLRIIYKARDPRGQEDAAGLEMIVHGGPC